MSWRKPMPKSLKELRADARYRLPAKARRQWQETKRDHTLDDRRAAETLERLVYESKEK